MNEYFASGKVFLVGAGPGDPELITVKGLNAVRKADVILYDYLVSPSLLDNAGTETECRFVGKKCGKHSIDQEEINRTLIEKARTGNIVVRLKGGDPFVFGRGGEEAEALFNAGIEFEIIPGITAGIAVPAYAGIPVTHRNYSSSFALVTGIRSRSKNNKSLDWNKMAAGIETLVIYMGLGNLHYIVTQLIVQGKPVNTPVAVFKTAHALIKKRLLGLSVILLEKCQSIR